MLQNNNITPKRIALILIGYVLPLTGPVFICPAAAVESWPGEPVGQSGGKFDTDTGLPVVRPDGRQEISYTPGFRPSILTTADGTIRFLRTHTFLVNEPIDYDPNTGIPIFGDFWEIEYVSLSPAERWTYSTPLHPRAENIRAPVLVGAGGGGFGVYHLREDSIVVDLFYGETTETIELPMDADRAEVAIEDRERVHIVWTGESGLWYGVHQDAEWDPVQLSGPGVESVRIVAGDGLVHVLYARRVEGEASEVTYRHIDETIPGPEEIVYSGEALIEHIDLILDAEGMPAVGFVDPAGSAANIARRVNGEWDVRTLSAEYSETGPLAIALDPNGDLCIALIANGGKELWYGSVADSDLEQVSTSEFDEFHFGVDLAFRDDGTPVILSAEREPLLLKMYSARTPPAMFELLRRVPQMTSDGYIQWYAGDGAFHFRDLEISVDLSWGREYCCGVRQTVFDASGRRMFRMKIDIETGMRFFRAVYRDLRRD